MSYSDWLKKKKEEEENEEKKSSGGSSYNSYSDWLKNKKAQGTGLDENEANVYNSKLARYDSDLNSFFGGGNVDTKSLLEQENDILDYTRKNASKLGTSEVNRINDSIYNNRKNWYNESQYRDYFNFADKYGATKHAERTTSLDDLKNQITAYQTKIRDKTATDKDFQDYNSLVNEYKYLLDYDSYAGAGAVKSLSGDEQIRKYNELSASHDVFSKIGSNSSAFPIPQGYDDTEAQYQMEQLEKYGDPMTQAYIRQKKYGERQHEADTLDLQAREMDVDRYGTNMEAAEQYARAKSEARTEQLNEAELLYTQNRKYERSGKVLDNALLVARENGDTVESIAQKASAYLSEDIDKAWDDVTNLGRSNDLKGQMRASGYKWLRNDDGTVSLYDSDGREHSDRENSEDFSSYISGTKLKAKYPDLYRLLEQYDSGSTDVGLLDFVSKDDLTMLSYFLSTEGKDAAKQYADDLKGVLERRKDDYTNGQMQKLADSGLFGRAVATGVKVVGDIAGAPFSFGSDLVNTLSGNEINPYDEWHSLSNAAEAAGTAVSENLARRYPNFKIFGQNGASFLYNALVSGAESLVGAKSAGKAYTFIMGMNAAQQRAKELYERGASNEDIFTGSLTAGVNEALFEYVSLDHFLSGESPTSWVDGIKKVLAQSGIEASEELATSIANHIDDEITLGVNSDFNVRIREIQETEGLSYEEARRKAAKEKIESIMADGLAGALSSLSMGGNIMTQAVQNQRTGKNIQRGATADYFVEAGLNEDADSRAYKLANEIRKEGAYNVNSMKLGALANDIIRKSNNISAEKREELQEYTKKATNRKAIEQRLRDGGVREDRIELTTDAVIKTINGEQTNRKESRAVEYQDAAQEYVNEVQNKQADIIGEINEADVQTMTGQVLSNARAVRTEENTKALARAPLGGASIREANTVRKGTRISEDNTARDSQGNEIDLGNSKVVSIDNGVATVELNDGNRTQVKSNDITYANNDQAVIYETLANVEGMTPENMNFFVAMRKSVDTDVNAGVWAKGIAEGYNLGYTFADNQRVLAKAEQSARYLSNISNDMRLKAEEYGKEAARQSRKTTAQTTLRDERNIKKGESTEEQHKRVQDLAKRLGLEIVYDDTIKGDGEYVNGKQVVLRHDTADPVAFVLKHELTHFAESSNDYAAFADAVVKSKAFEEWIAEQTTRSDKTSERRAEYLVDLKKRYNRHGVKLSYSAAQREMIANFVGDMLFNENGSGIEGMTRGMNTADRNAVIKFLDKLISWFKKHFGGDVAEIKALEQMFNKALSTSEGKQTSEEQASISDRQDADYLSAVESGDMETAQRMVDESAKAAGYDTPMLYHGTTKFGFTVFSNEFSDDRLSFFVTESPDMAQTYSGTARIARLNKLAKVDFNTLSGKEIQDIYNDLMGDDKAIFVSPNDEKIRSKVTTDAIDAFIDNKRIDKWVNDMDESGAFNKSYLLDSIEKFKNNPTAETADKLYRVFEALYHNSDYAYYVQERPDIARDMQAPIMSALAMYSDYIAKRSGFVTYPISAMFTGKSVMVCKDLPTFVNSVVKPAFHKGNYALYGKKGNQLVIDAKGKQWNGININDYLNTPFGDAIKQDYGEEYFDHSIQRVNTREISEYAYKAGYDSVLIKDVVDNGGIGANAGRGNLQIYYNSNNLKSADPVTYDDNGNVIPLSERFNPANEDIRYSIPDRTAKTEANNYTVREIEKLNESVSDLKGLLWLTKTETSGAIATQTSVNRAADKIMDKWGISRGKGTIARMLSELYTEAKMLTKNGTPTFDELAKAAEPLVSKIVNELNYSEKNENAADALRMIKGVKIKLNAEQRSEVLSSFDSLQNWKHALKGTVVYSPNATSGLDLLWDEWASLHPEYFDPEVINSAEMPRILTEVVKQILNDQTIEQEYTDEMYEEDRQNALADVLHAIAEITPTQTFADTKAKEIAGLKQRFNERLDTLRTEKNEKISEVKQHAREMREKGVESRKRTRLREDIQKIAADFQKRMNSPSENAYVPQEFYGVVAAAMNDLLGATKSTSEAKMARIAELQRYYESIAKTEAEKEAFNYPVVDGLLRKLRDIVAVKTVTGTINDPLAMTSAELQTVKDAFKAIQHAIRESVRLTNSKFKEEVKDIGTTWIEEMSDVKRDRSRSRFNLWQATPDTAFNMFAGFKKNSVSSRLYEMLNEGQLKMSQIEMEGSSMFYDLTNNQEGVKSFFSTKDSDMVDVGLVGENGKPIKITHGMLVSLYMHLQNKQNARHFAIGGLKVPDIQTYYGNNSQKAWDSKRRVDVRGKNAELLEISKQITALVEEKDKSGTTTERRAQIENELEKIAQRADTLVDDYVADVREQIEAQLTEYDRQWISTCQEFFDGFSKDVINEATLARYGFEKARVDGYFPIRTDESFTKSDIDKIVRDFSLEGIGTLKERVQGANNRIYLEDITAIVNRQIGTVARIGGLLVPLHNFSKVYNVDNGGGKSVKGSVEKVFGNKSGNKYIENLLADLNGARQVSDEAGAAFMRFLRGNMAKAALTLNPRVAFAQAASYPTASYILDAESLIKALGLVKKEDGTKRILFAKADQEAIQKYTPLLWKRLQGYTAIELGDIRSSNSLKNKTRRATKGLTGWITAMDTATVGRLWYATKYYIEKHNPSLEVGSEEYYKAVAAKFNEVVEKTQPNYTTMQRPAALRSQSEIVRSLTMFMTQRLQNYNILYSSISKYNQYARDFKNNEHNGVTEEDVRAARKQMNSAITSQIVQGVTITLMKAFTDVLLYGLGGYKDDDDELTAKSFFSRLAWNFLETETSNITFGSELYKIFNKLYDVATDKKSTYYPVSLSGVDTLIDGIEHGVKFMSTAIEAIKGKKDIGDIKDTAWKVAKDLSQALGIPLNNVSKIANAFYNYGTDIANGTFGTFTRDSDYTATQNINRLYNAIASGDYDAVKIVKSEYKSLDEYEKAVKQGLRDNEPRIAEAAAYYYSGETAKGDIDEAAIKQEFPKFRRDQIENAVEAEQNAIENGVKKVVELYGDGDVEASAEKQNELVEKYPKAKEAIEAAVAEGTKGINPEEARKNKDKWREEDQQEDGVTGAWKHYGADRLTLSLQENSPNSISEAVENAKYLVSQGKASTAATAVREYYKPLYREAARKGDTNKQDEIKAIVEKFQKVGCWKYDKDDKENKNLTNLLNGWLK